VFTERVTALGATVKATPGPQGNRLSITFPGATRQWTLDPQIQMGSSRPDFVLRSSQGSLPVVAIFTDGWLYHASPAHNRIADDARKRQELRDGGTIVLGITARDVEHARNGSFEAPAWLRNDVIATLLGSGVTFRPQNVEAIQRGPVDFLLSWIQSPDVDGLRALANHLPLMFAPAAQHFTMDPTADLAREAGARLLDPERITPAGDMASAAWWWSAGSVGCLTRTSGSTLEVALMIDDRTEELADKDQAADGWREWLRLSNALNLREQPTVVTAVSDASLQGMTEHAKHEPVPDKDAALPTEWQLAHDSTISSAEQAFIEKLARYAMRDAAQSIAVPVVGYEAEDGIPLDFAWPDQRVAACLDLDANERRVLETAGWRVFPDDPGAVFAALRGAA
jgi:hypothetical protein